MHVFGTTPCGCRCRGRLESWKQAEFVEQQSRTAVFARRLRELGLRLPGCGADLKTFWCEHCLVHAWPVLDSVYSCHIARSRFVDSFEPIRRCFCRLFPVLTPVRSSVDTFVNTLRKNGLFAGTDASTLVCYSSSPGVTGGVKFPDAAADMMRRIVYLPVNRRSSQNELQQVEAAMAKTVITLESNPDASGASDLHK